MLESLEERALVLRAQQGDKDALNQLAQAYRPLICAAAKRFYANESIFPRDEFMQAGYLGLLLAIERYVPDMGAALGTYALPWILGEMKRAIRKAIDATGVYEKRRIISREEARMQASLGRSPTIEELAAACNMEALEIADIISISNPLASGAPDQETGGSFLEQIASDDASAQDRLELRMALDSLSADERKLILLRYFRDSTQAETARAMGKSQAQVSRIERRALDRLRTMLA